MRYDKYKVHAQLFNAFSFISNTNWAKEVYNETTSPCHKFYVRKIGCNHSGAAISMHQLIVFVHDQLIGSNSNHKVS